MDTVSKSPRSRLVEAMMRPEFYPDRPSSVEHKQTHMSDVFLADDYVYKIKKPVCLDFVDCWALGARYLLCREELRLNRRLAPEAYLDVVPMLESGAEVILGDAGQIFDHKVREYAVKMRRLPDERMLDRLVREGQADRSVIATLAANLAAFHAEASSAKGWLYGSATAVARLVLGNLEESRRYSGSTITALQLSGIEDYLTSFIAAHRELLNDRARDGHVRECHGDLRCEHVCMTSQIQIFDCVEFSERLRYSDVASDIAFLAMDLDSLGQHMLADELVHAYSQKTTDEHLATLVNFYKCYRACVRGKVESLKSLENEVSAEERQQAREQARAHFALAFTYASRGKPALLVVCGLSGTGKSTVCRKLQCRTGFQVLSSDRVRKRLAGVPQTTRAYTPYGEGIYTSGFDRLTYDAVLADASARLREGCGVIIDATFKRPADRRRALAIGQHLGLPVLFVECRADEKEVLKRLDARGAQSDDASDATAEVYLAQRAEFVPLTELSAKHHVVVDSTEDAEGMMRRIEACLGRAFDSGVHEERAADTPAG